MHKCAYKSANINNNIVKANIIYKFHAIGKVRNEINAYLLVGSRAQDQEHRNKDQFLNWNQKRTSKNFRCA